MAERNGIIGSGHQVSIKVDGKEIGAARGLNMNQDFGVEPAHVIGTIMPIEHTPQRWSGTVELDKFFIRRDVGVKANVDLSSEGVLIIQPVDIEAIDKQSGETVFIAQGCTLQSSGVQISANAYIGERATFTALRIVRNEIGSPILQSGV
jgi:hypothetical protein